MEECTDYFWDYIKQTNKTEQQQRKKRKHRLGLPIVMTIFKSPVSLEWSPITSRWLTVHACFGRCYQWRARFRVLWIEMEIRRELGSPRKLLTASPGPEISKAVNKADVFIIVQRGGGGTDGYRDPRDAHRLLILRIPYSKVTSQYCPIRQTVKVQIDCLSTLFQWLLSSTSATSMRYEYKARKPTTHVVVVLRQRTAARYNRNVANWWHETSDLPEVA